MDKAKGGTGIMGKIVAKLASLAGFEPTTRCLEGSRSVQLSYRDIFLLFKCSMR